MQTSRFPVANEIQTDEVDVSSGEVKCISVVTKSSQEEEAELADALLVCTSTNVRKGTNNDELHTESR